jgi:arabinose-5-phosphate isomerase
MSENLLFLGKSLVNREASALVELSESLTEEFCHVVNTILKLKGRVITSGIGKSSHIAKKITSTFASTGTPAFFIHPTEASHGDLGMITADDMVIAFSRSGESAELKDIILFCKKQSIPLIGITSVRDSTLAKAANLNLFLPNVDEACTLGLAPTTSSIMMLALGDALAVACLEKRRFTKEDFKVFHPAGKLGLSLLKVADIMHVEDELPLVDSSASLSDAILEMTRCRFGCVGVIDNAGQLVGIFTDGDLRRNLSSTDLSRPMIQLMTRDPQMLDADVYAMDVVKVFREKRIPSIFVCRSMKPTGILHLHDLLQKGLL